MAINLKRKNIGLVVLILIGLILVGKFLFSSFQSSLFEDHSNSNDGAPRVISENESMLFPSLGFAGRQIGLFDWFSSPKSEQHSRIMYIETCGAGVPPISFQRLVFQYGKRAQVPIEEVSQMERLADLADMTNLLFEEADQSKKSMLQRTIPGVLIVKNLQTSLDETKDISFSFEDFLSAYGVFLSLRNPISDNSRFPSGCQLYSFIALLTAGSSRELSESKFLELATLTSFIEGKLVMVLIPEIFDESLVLAKMKLKLSWQDILESEIQQKLQNLQEDQDEKQDRESAAKEFEKTFSALDPQIQSKFVKAEQQLYDHFKSSLESLSGASSAFQQEVSYYKRLKFRYLEHCEELGPTALKLIELPPLSSDLENRITGDLHGISCQKKSVDTPLSEIKKLHPTMAPGQLEEMKKSHKTSDQEKKKISEYTNSNDNIQNAKAPSVVGDHTADVKVQETTCKPISKFVWIKTHKTGSSTLTNLFHRFSWKRNLTIVIPRDNIFLGWPFKQRLLSSIQEIPSFDSPPKPFDVLCSAHSRFQPSVTDTLIPGAVYITLLRDPVSHFLSSWNYWHIEDHYRVRKGIAMPLSKFLTNPRANIKLATDADQRLLDNSMTFDLGLEGLDDSLKKVEGLIQSMEKRFPVVLITEYLDESLVLLKRKMCWELDDIMYYALKVNVRQSKPSLPQSDLNKIIEFNRQDWKLYQYFNNSLWEQINKEKDFFEEVNELKARNLELSLQCEHFATVTEDGHRKALLEQNLAPLDRQCHYAMLDSVGFVKMFKRKEGLEVKECQGQRQARKVVYIKTHKTGSSTLTNLFHRAAVKYNLKTVLPKDNIFLGWPNPENIPTSYETSGKRAGPFEMFCSGHARYHAQYLAKVVPEAKYITILRDPLAHFVSSWHYWHIEDHFMKFKNIKVTMKQFLDDIPRYYELATESDRKLLHNTMFYDLGGTADPTDAEVTALVRHVYASFSTVLITEYMDESLVLLRRSLCWDLDDVKYFSLKVVSGKKASRPALPAHHQEALKKFNKADTLLYDVFNKTLWKRIANEVGFDAELAELRRKIEALRAQCAPFQNLNDEDRRKILIEKDKTLTPEQRECHLAMLDSMGFVKLLKFHEKIPVQECKTQFPRKTLIYVQSHGPAGRTLSNLVWRFAWNLDLEVAFPKDGESFGWPSLEQKDIEQSVYNWDDEQQPKFSFLTGGYVRMNTVALNSLVPDGKYFGKYIALVTHPVHQFLHSWVEMDMKHLLRERFNKDISLEDFVSGFASISTKLSPEELRLFENTMAFDFGVDLDKKDGNSIRQDLDRTINDLRRYLFGTSLVQEHLDESLIVMKRYVCLDFDDLLFLDRTYQHTMDFQKSELYRSLDETTIAEIEAINDYDMEIFSKVNASLWDVIGKEINFHQEVEDFRAYRAQMNKKCDSALKQFSTRKDVFEFLMKQPKWKIARANKMSEKSPAIFCGMCSLTPKEFADLYTARNFKPQEEEDYDPEEE